MRRKRKVWYEVTRFDYFFYDKVEGWNQKFGSSHRFFNTANRAFNHAATLPPGSVLIKWFYRKGVRCIREYERR